VIPDLSLGQELGSSWSPGALPRADRAAEGLGLGLIIGSSLLAAFAVPAILGDGAVGRSGIDRLAFWGCQGPQVCRVGDSVTTMTHTEHVHLLFGVGLAMTGLLWLAAQNYPASLLRYLWPPLLFAVGLFLLIPTETQERTYTQVDAWNTFLSVFPNSLSVWLTTVQQPHVIQHKVTGTCAMLAGAIEASRAFGWLCTPQWRWALPILTIVAGLAIGYHGGTHQHLPRVTEQAHHWILGAALVLGGTVHAVAIGHAPKDLIAQRLLPALILLAGLDLIFFYRLR
jgi:hypothetical protein